VTVTLGKDSTIFLSRPVSLACLLIMNLVCTLNRSAAGPGGPTSEALL